jgi:hypothetical protein
LIRFTPARFSLKVFAICAHHSVYPCT